MKKLGYQCEYCNSVHEDPTVAEACEILCKADNVDEKVVADVCLKLSHNEREDILQSLRQRLPTLVETSKDGFKRLIDYVDSAGSDENVYFDK